MAFPENFPKSSAFTRDAKIQQSIEGLDVSNIINIYGVTEFFLWLLPINLACFKARIINKGNPWMEFMNLEFPSWHSRNKSD